MNTEWDEQAEHDRDLEWESRMDLERTEATCDWVDHFSQFIDNLSSDAKCRNGNSGDEISPPVSTAHFAQVGEISSGDVCVPASEESNFGSESEPYTHEEAEARRKEFYES